MLCGALCHLQSATQQLRHVLTADSKANAGWVSGIVRKAVSAEVSIASVGARPAHKQPPYAGRMRAPAHIAYQQEEEEDKEEQQQDMRVRAATDAARSVRQQQHEAQTEPDEQEEPSKDSRAAAKAGQDAKPTNKADAPAKSGA